MLATPKMKTKPGDLIAIVGQTPSQLGRQTQTTGYQWDGVPIWPDGGKGTSSRLRIRDYQEGGHLPPWGAGGTYVYTITGSQGRQHPIWSFAYSQKQRGTPIVSDLKFPCGSRIGSERHHHRDALSTRIHPQAVFFPETALFFMEKSAGKNDVHACIFCAFRVDLCASGWHTGFNK
jgi:hypothetical protein